MSDVCRLKKCMGMIVVVNSVIGLVMSSILYTLDVGDYFTTIRVIDLCSIIYFSSRLLQLIIFPLLRYVRNESRSSISDHYFRMEENPKCMPMVCVFEFLLVLFAISILFFRRACYEEFPETKSQMEFGKYISMQISSCIAVINNLCRLSSYGVTLYDGNNEGHCSWCC